MKTKKSFFLDKYFGALRKPSTVRMDQIFYKNILQVFNCLVFYCIILVCSVWLHFVFFIIFVTEVFERLSGENSL